jgi:hypothetical protein
MTKVKNPLKRLYRQLNSNQQAQIDRLRFSFGQLPRITNARAGREWLPQPYRAAVVVSCDFELGWAFRHGRRQGDAPERANQKARQTRLNLPVLLEMFDAYQTPVTWATVGHLFLNSCQKEDGQPHRNLPRPPYFENEHWSFQTGDWYDADPCSDLKSAPEWYAPDLIENILAARVKHEIACHTFSHIDCSDGVCPPEVLSSELSVCQNLAAKSGINLKSFVFPGNFAGNYSILKDCGFTNYRSQLQVNLGVPALDRVGLCAIPGGIFWEIEPGWRVKEWVHVLQHCVDLALQKNLVFHLWFHPSCEDVNIRQVFPDVLAYIHERREELWMVTMKELSERFLDS